MVGVSHGGGLNSHGTDAESFPSEQDTEQLGQSVAIHGMDEGFKLIIEDFIYSLLYLEQSLLSLDGETAQPSLTLSETETVFILSMDSCIVASDAKDLEAVKQQNERFIEVKIKGKIIFLSVYIFLVT